MLKSFPASGSRTDSPTGSHLLARPRWTRRRIVAAWLLVAAWVSFSASCWGQAAPNAPSAAAGSAIRTYWAQDGLAAQPDSNPDAEQCLAQFRWQPTHFRVEVHPPEEPGAYADVRFPSPLPCGIEATDMVHAEWYAVLDEDTSAVLPAPVYIIVHESGSGMRVGRLIASSLPPLGLHGLMVQLPGYGQRKSKELDQHNLPALIRQGIADVRRARDAAAAIEAMQSKRIGLQGTSLGGFVATLAGSLDGCFDANILLLCGGDLYQILSNGQKDAAKTMERLRTAGLGEEELRRQLQSIEPLRIAHRLPVDRTWLYAARYDQVVPLRNAELLADKIGLPENRFIRLPCNHYSGIIYLPSILAKMRDALAHDH